MEEGHSNFEHPDLTIQYNVPPPREQEESPDPEKESRNVDPELWERLTSQTWKVSRIESVSDWPDLPAIEDSGVRIILRGEKIGCLEFNLSELAVVGFEKIREDECNRVLQTQPTGRGIKEFFAGNFEPRRGEIKDGLTDVVFKGEPTAPRFP